MVKHDNDSPFLPETTERSISMRPSGFTNRFLKWSIAMIILACLPLFTNNYSQYVINLIFIYILLAFGLNVILGYCGQFSFAHAGFYGIGAYTCGYLINRLGIPFWFSLPLGGIAGAIGAFILSFPARRLEKYWLAIITLSFTEIMAWIFSHWTTVTEGVSGMIIHRPSLFGLPINTEQKVYYVNLIVCILMMIAGRRMISSRIGRAFVSIREGVVPAQCFGISPSRYKVMAYVISGFYAGIAGGLLGVNVGIIMPSTFDSYQMAILIAMVVIGGIGTFVGSIAGAVLLTTLPEILRQSQAYQEMIYGFLLLFILIFMPRGIQGAIGRIRLLPKETLHIR